MHSRDTTVLIDLLWFNVVYYSSLFQYFLQSTMAPTLVENSWFFNALVLETLFMIMIEIQYSDTALYYYWRTHACHIKTRHCAPQLYQLSSEKKTLCCHLSSTHCTAVQINNCLKRTFAIKVSTMKIMDSFHYEWKPSRAYHKIDTFCHEQRWMGHKGGHW